MGRLLTCALPGTCGVARPVSSERRPNQRVVRLRAAPSRLAAPMTRPTVAAPLSLGWRSAHQAPREAPHCRAASGEPSWPMRPAGELPEPEKEAWWQGLLRSMCMAFNVLSALVLSGMLFPSTSHASSQAGRAADCSAATAAAVAVAESSGRPAVAYRDTGILLAVADDTGTETLEPKPLNMDDMQLSIEKYMEDADKRKLLTKKKGKKVEDLHKSVVDPPENTPIDEKDVLLADVRTAWRTDKLREMTYTQFWILTREGRVDKVKFTTDGRSAFVTTKENAPGGARTEKVGLPYDPDLMHHLIEHGVEVELTPINRMNTVIIAVMRLAFPLWLALYMVKFAFRLGRKKQRDKLFGGVRMDMVKSRDIAISFNDVAGIDQVKSEITEVVAFLRNPKKFMDLGARSPAGVLLVGPPGTGKTLLAKAIAGEAGVPFFSASGTEFMEMFVGVGASRVRDMFEKARKNSPCILFIDEFDGLGKQRSYGGAAGNDESVHTINQLLTEMDGFEDNTGVVVMAATNRPASLDNALTRPGRFDRIIHLPLPNQQGRVEIMAVHTRDKEVDPGVDFSRVARATAGFTGAELMNLMNQSAIVAVRQSRKSITEDDVFEALEKIHMERMGRGGQSITYEEDIVPPLMRRNIAVYECAKALLAHVTPNYEELSKMSVCPGGVPTSYSYFIPQEAHLETQVVTRAYMESKLAVLMAGRVAERTLLGEDYISTAGANDLEVANDVAREMIFRCGFSRRLGPVSLMDDEEVYLNRHETRMVANLSVEMGAIAQQEIRDLLDGAEAKAYYALVSNYKALKVLVETMYTRESISGKEVASILDTNGAMALESPFVKGYYWDDDGALITPDAPPDRVGRVEGMWSEAPKEYPDFPLKPGYAGSTTAPYRVRIDLPDHISANDEIVKGLRL
mmetsp:Transcript_28408/g.50750  ORF Transcript_28408/g.50750 Transcript_28408/m.50750 type:complete len:912 (-) Transcript_28408:144-2879(-)